MRLVVRLLGCEVLAVETGPETGPADKGDCLASPVGFTMPPAVPCEADFPDRA